MVQLRIYKTGRADLLPLPILDNLVHLLPLSIILVGVILHLDALVLFAPFSAYAAFMFFFMQEIFRDFIIFMGVIMSGTCKVHLRQETQV